MHTQKIQAIGARTRDHFGALAAQLTALPENHNVMALIDEFIACFDITPAYAGYKHIPAQARKVCEQITKRLGKQKTQDFLYASILRAILKTLDSAAFARLPTRVMGHQLKQFDRLVSNANAITQSSDINNDLFHKEFGLASLRLYAAASNVVDYNSGLERALLLRGGWFDMPRRLMAFMKIGGFKPFFELHTHLSYLDEYNAEGRRECYRCCVDLYALHPAMLGMFAGSWLYDPELSTVSPRLAYMRQIAQDGGAYVFFNAIDDQSTQDAIAKSPTRRQLYADGVYQPRNYALIWPRASQIQWAKSNQT